MDSRLSLSHIVAPGEVGGLESVVGALAAGMARRSHRVRILSLLGTRAPRGAFDGASRSGVELVEVRLPPRSYRSEVARLAVLLNGDSIVHSHGYHADLVGYRAAGRALRPIVSTAHGFVGGGLKNRVYEWLDIQALRRFDGVVAVARPLSERLLRAGVPPDRLHLIPNAYLPDRPAASREAARGQLGIPDQSLVAGWVGRLSHEKGPDVFLEALALAPEWIGSIIGGGPLLPELKERARSLGVNSRIRWEGIIPEAGHLLAAFDALVLSSRTEGTPMVLLEGMFAEVPLVVTRVGGVPDVVTQAEAILAPSEDPGAVAAALEAIRADRDAAQRRSVLARARLESAHAVEPWLDRHETLYRGLVAKR